MKRMLFNFLSLLAFSSLLFSAPILAAQSKTLEMPFGSKEMQFSGNTQTLKYHAPGCRYYHCKTCTKFFKSPQAARKAGYEPCGVCEGKLAK